MSETPRQTGYRWVPLSLIVLGALLALGAIFADAIGFSWGGDGFGWKQLMATIAGLIIALVRHRPLVPPLDAATSDLSVSWRGREPKI